jgi:hypothetical protein
VREAAAKVCDGPVSNYQLVAAAATYIFKLSPAFEVRVAAKVEALHGLGLPLSGPYAAVHIRTGDKLIKESRMGLQFGVDTPEFWVRVINGTFPTTSPVYLAVDDCSMAQNVSAALRKLGNRTVVHSCGDAPIESIGRASWREVLNVDNCDDVDRLLAEIRIIAGARFVLADLNSNVPHLALKLRWHRMQAEASDPFLLVDPMEGVYDVKSEWFRNRSAPVASRRRKWIPEITLDKMS